MLYFVEELLNDIHCRPTSRKNVYVKVNLKLILPVASSVYCRVFFAFKELKLQSTNLYHL